jgi:hypothetical protein
MLKSTKFSELFTITYYIFFTEFMSSLGSFYLLNNTNTIGNIKQMYQIPHISKHVTKSY